MPIVLQDPIKKINLYPIVMGERLDQKAPCFLIHISTFGNRYLKYWPKTFLHILRSFWG
jgi:hypothetical protein